MAIPVFATGDVPTASQVNDWFVNTKIARKTGNTSRSSTITLTDDPDITLTVIANAVYEVRFMLLQTGNAAGDFKWQWLGPTGASFDHALVTCFAAAGAYADDQTIGASIGTPYSSGSIVSNPVPCWGNGLLVMGANSGSFKLQWSQATSNAGSTTLFTGSYLILNRVS